jgi:hypothetical protein
MSYVDLYKRYYQVVQGEKREESELNKYMTFYNSLEQSLRIQTHDVAIKNPEEGCQVTTVVVDFSGDDQADPQLVEKVLVRLADEAEFTSQGAAILVTSDRDGKHLISLFNKTLYKKDLTM